MRLRRLLFRLLIVAALSFGLDVLGTWYVLALNQRAVFLMVAITFAIPWVRFIDLGWWVDERTTTGRAWLTLADAVGATVGTVVALAVFPEA